MNYTEIGKLIVDIGILPGMIAALLYFIYKLINENNKSMIDLTCALSDNTNALNMLTEFVKGRQP